MVEKKGSLTDVKRDALLARLKFAHAFNNLLRDRLKTGRNLCGIKIQAAKLAGFGAGSWCEEMAYRTRRTMASRMMKDAVVIQELKKLGLKPHPLTKNEWLIADSFPAIQNEFANME